jgi:enoyl-CoA hydratase/carnithine racemase
MGDLAAYSRKDHLGIVTLNRPQALNAISSEMASNVADAFEEALDDEDAWVVILRAEGVKAFCVGADLKERAAFTLDDFRANRKQMTRMFASVRQIRQPTIAAIFGFALGGGFELALSCDLIVAAEGSEMGLPEARVGLLPAGGGTQLLTRRVTPSMAKELIFTGRRTDAIKASELGLVTRVVRREALDDATVALAAEICESSPVALREAKRSIDAALGTPLEEGMDLENEAWKVVVASEDRAEGIAAFNEKRPPRWRNR